MKVPIFFIAAVMLMLLLGGLVTCYATRSHRIEAVATDAGEGPDAGERAATKEGLDAGEGTFDPADVPEFEVQRDEMVEEVVLLWERFYDLEGARANDPRRGNFERYARYVADAVVLYQNQETDIGGRLPRDRNAHLIVATLTTKESSVDANVVGQLGEVGLMQLMPRGPAIASMRPEFVQKRPEIQVLLGTRWLAYHIQTCYPDGIEDAEWTDGDWAGPLSVYAAGPGGVCKKTGRCFQFKTSRERVALTRMYRTWIDGEKAVRGRN